MNKYLTDTHPELCNEWDYARNKGIYNRDGVQVTPMNITRGTNTYVWWKCSKSKSHTYRAQVCNRTNKKNLTGCPYCAGKKVSMIDSILFTHPKAANMWNHKKNKDLTTKRYGKTIQLIPENVASSWEEKVWWKCHVANDHVFEASISAICKSIEINSKFKGCLVCAGRIVVKSNCLTTTHPKVARRWHSTKNGDLRSNDVTAGERRLVWWNCDVAEDHEYQAWIYNLTGKDEGCSVCKGNIVVKSNCLEITHPRLAEQWDFEKNNKLRFYKFEKEYVPTPKTVTHGNNETVYWKCDIADDHRWAAKINNRANGTDCPCCEGQKIVESNCLKTTDPHLEEEWDYAMNDKLTLGRKKGTEIIQINPKTISRGSNQKVNWICSINNEHKWSESIYNRASNLSGCPFCRIRNQSKEEIYIIFELKYFFGKMNPKGFRIKGRKKVFAMDMLIKELNLVIEYDGHYWHRGKKNKNKDKQKSKAILEEGFDLIRLRQKPLKPINENDIVVDRPLKPKKAVLYILEFIESNYELSKQRKDKIERYRKMNGLANYDNAISYIKELVGA